MGENILIATEDVSGDAVVLKWLEEEEKYDYDLERWQRGRSRVTGGQRSRASQRVQGRSVAVGRVHERG